MVFPKARVGVAAALFVGWLGFLLYLVIVTRAPIILSRPQFLVTQLCVLAQIEERDGRPAADVVVREQLWAGEQIKVVEGQALRLEDLPDVGPRQGWDGAGVYLLALTQRTIGDQVTYALTELPPMPGYQPATVAVELLDPGPRSGEVTAFLQKMLGVDAKHAEALTQPLRRIKRGLSYDEAESWKEELKKLGAETHLQGYETRIYRATEDALRQFYELKPTGKRASGG